MEHRFVIQIHRGWGPTHFDLMIEDGPALATWQFADSPAGMAAGEWVRCRRIADHRRAYLTYEGPVSRGRGEVSILDGGPCEVIERGETGWRVRFGGEQLRGVFRLQATGDGWAFSREGSAGPGVS